MFYKEVFLVFVENLNLKACFAAYCTGGIRGLEQNRYKEWPIFILFFIILFDTSRTITVFGTGHNIIRFTT